MQSPPTLDLIGVGRPTVVSHESLGRITINRYIALYRGINVGGANRVKMEPLRTLHEGMGHRSVASYVQSGNIVFTARGLPQTIAKHLASAFTLEFGFPARLLVVDSKRWNVIVRNNPFAAAGKAHPTCVHVALCDGQPNEQGIRALHLKMGGTESFALRDDVIYVHAPDGIGRSKFVAGLEKACGVAATMRNWRTVEAISALLADAGEKRLRSHRSRSA